MQENKVDDARRKLHTVVEQYGGTQEAAEATHLLALLDTPKAQDESSLRHELLVQVGRFTLDCGRYPTEQEGLKALLVDPGVQGWKGPYLDREWMGKIGRFEYRTSEGRPEIVAKR